MWSFTQMWHKNRTCFIVRQNIGSFKSTASCVGRGEQKKMWLTLGISIRQAWHASASLMWRKHWPHVEQLAVVCARSQIISSRCEDWQTDNEVWQGSSKHLGFSLISVTWHAWQWGLKAEHPAKCKSLATSNLERPSMITSTSFEPFTTQRRHDSQIKAPANYVHGARV